MLNQKFSVMQCKTIQLKAMLQAGTMLFAVFYTLLLVYHNLGAAEQNLKQTFAQWKERDPRSLPGDCETCLAETLNNTKLVKKHSANGTETTSKIVNTDANFNETVVNNSVTELDDIFISVKTSKKFHKVRLPIVLNTWFQLAKNQTWFFSDSDDPSIDRITNGHLINTKCGSSHSRKHLCCKMGAEIDFYAESNKKWFCHFDDDNYVNIPRLVKVLNNYNPQEDWYLGRPSMMSPVTLKQNIRKKKESKKHDERPGKTKNIKFWFATGGAGFCVSRGLALQMVPIAAGGKFISLCELIRLPDDVTIGYIIEYILKKSLTVVHSFHSHLEPLGVFKQYSLPKQITLSYSGHGHLGKNTLHIRGFDEKKDWTRIFSLHCFLFPKSSSCKR